MLSFSISYTFTVHELRILVFPNCFEAQKIAKHLEDIQAMEALLLQKRIQLVQHAQNIYERLEGMSRDELHKTLQPLADDNIEWPAITMSRLVKRRCQEGMDSSDIDVNFLDAWQPWPTGEVEEFCPLRPRFDSALAAILDKYNQADFAASDGEDDGQAEGELNQSKELDLKAGLCCRFCCDFDLDLGSRL